LLQLPAILLVLALTAAQAPDEQTPEMELPAAVRDAPFPVTPGELMGHVAFLAHDRMRGRAAGTIEEAVAAAYIAAEFQKLGLEPAGMDGAYEQPFQGARGEPGEGGQMNIVQWESRNVLAWLPGSEDSQEYVLIGAHYDHLGVGPDGAIFNGADDNASGVAGLIGIAKALVSAEARPRRAILFAAFGSEERGIVGSEHYAKNPVRELEGLAAMINIDMIGRGRFLDRAMFAIPKRLMGITDGAGVGLLGSQSDGGSGGELLALAKAACAHEGLPAYAPEDFPRLKTLIEGATAGRGDFEPFRRRGVPTIFFSTSENDDYHQPTDTPDKIDPVALHRITRTIYRFVLALDVLPSRVLEAAAEK
jgi:Zn-dependent M28 family amino/carboxypeptidase